MRLLSIALGFLTTLPMPVRGEVTSGDLARSTALFPLAGLCLGLLLVGANGLLAQTFPPAIQAALALTLWVALTGALHLDGFLDACDGLFGGRTPEARLRILRDERVGAFAVAGGVLLLLLKYSALAASPDRMLALLLSPTLGRWGVTLAVVLYPYARSEGLGRAMKDHAGWPQAALATATALVVAWFAAEWQGLAALTLAGVTTWAVARFVLRRLPGLTRDIYGAICETVECLVLLLLAAEVDWGKIVWLG